MKMTSNIGKAVTGKKMYTYFVAYTYRKSDGEMGFCNCSIESRYEIKSFDDLQIIKQELENRYSLENAIILNYQLLN